MLDQLGDLAGKTITADALLTQTATAEYLRKHDAHYMFIAENSVHRILDDTDAWNEDNNRIRTGHGPENMTRLRRFAIGVIKAHGKSVAPTLRKLHRTPRLLLDYLKMTANTRHKPAIA